MQNTYIRIKGVVSLCNFQQHVMAIGYDLMYFKSGICYCSLDTGAAYIEVWFFQVLVVSMCGLCMIQTIFA